MTPTLEILQPVKWAGQTVPISPFPYLIGRDAQCTLRISNRIISRRHCCLFARGYHLIVRDFNSTNGTLVNDQPLLGERELDEGDRLTVGPFTFAVHLDEPSETFLMSQADRESIVAEPVPVLANEGGGWRAPNA